MNRGRTLKFGLFFFSLLSLLLALVYADTRITPELLANMRPRLIGPATVGGRITSLAIDEKRPAVMVVAAASGGVWKTVNKGTTWTPIFDDQGSASIGAVAIAPTNSDIVWVGTGESNARNSVAWGDGVYKSLDGGKTWTHTGLSDTHHIGKIVIHPKNPDIVYVAALGHLWGANEERGIFKTMNGGKTWERALFLSEDCGAIDLAMDPKRPDTLYAAAYQVRRDAFSGGNPAVQFGPQAGLYKTTDGGKNWTKLSKGLPTAQIGRSGISVYRKNPNIVYAVIQTEKTNIRQTVGQNPRENSDPETGGIFRSDDGGKSWKKLNDLCPRPFYYGKIRIDPNDDKRIYVLGVPLYVSEDGGKTFRSNGASGVHPDHHDLWIDPNDSDHLVLGCDGGLNISYDRARTWEFVNNLPIAQFYAVGYDLRNPYWIYGGMQDNGSWGTVTNTKDAAGITTHDWIRVGGGDGFYCEVDPTDPYTVYAESQYGGLTRVHIKTGESRSIRPRAPQGSQYRFNWCTPLIISPHHPQTLYYAGEHLFKSTDRGDRWETISPDLTRGTPGTISVIAESPLKPGLLWVGTDDGRIHLSRDGGQHWTDLSEKVPGVPQERCISRLEPSSANEGTAYLAIDRHRNDDQKPYLFKTTDYGETWLSITANLPENGSVYVVREHPKNPSLLFVGTEFGLFISGDGGVHWERVRNGFPTVAVHDLRIHPRENELIIATHGRGIYIMDIWPLNHFAGVSQASKIHMFDIKPAMVYRVRDFRSSGGAKAFRASNPPVGAALWYYVGEKLSEAPKIAISDAQGSLIWEGNGESEPGLHRLFWDLRPRPREGGQGAQGGFGARPMVAPGEYKVQITAGDVVQERSLKVEAEAE